MNFNELLSSLQNLIKDRRLRQVDIARALESSKSNISQKFINNSEVSVSELLKVQDFFGVKIYIKYDEISHVTHPASRFKTFGQRLNYFMGENNLTVETLSKLSGIPEVTIEKLGLDKIEPDLKIAQKLKNIFHVSLDLLIDGQEAGAASMLTPEEQKILDVIQKARKNNLI